VADAFGWVLFSLSGAQMAKTAQCTPIIVVLMGTLTGVAGGILREVITAQAPPILRRDTYPTAAIVGVGLGRVWLVVALRLLAIRWGLQLPILRVP
jgi:uncharacterized membrane protein YeiH